MDNPRVVCHTCYEPGHYSPDCVLPADSHAVVINNYARLTPDQQAWVPRVAFDNAIAQLQSHAHDEAQAATTTESKN